jgi:ubiquinone/menaquinone biosynthesis C-methylase UbiE
VPRRHDPSLYDGAAAHYVYGRPPYSAELVPVLSDALGLDGSGRMLDVGCGPGVLSVMFASRFEEVVALDPDTGMLAEAARRSALAGHTNVRFVTAVAEDIPQLGLGRFRAVLFGQSLHWTDRDRVVDVVYDILEPGGAIVCIAPDIEHRPEPPGPDLPRIPHQEIEQLVRQYLGPRRRAGKGFAKYNTERYEETLKRGRFGPPEVRFAPGRPDIVRDTESVLSGYLSMSFAAPHLFGDRLDEFSDDVRAVCRAHSPSGLFRDWPGDTVMVIGRKRA